DAETRGTDDQSVSGSRTGAGTTSSGTAATPTGASATPPDTGATRAGGTVDSSGQVDSSVSAAAVVAASDDHQDDWLLVLLPLLGIALLGVGFFYFFIAGKRRWRDREG
ncbi:MAG: hypothetical protein ABI658_22615, partial [Acidimicrobiales bacterium]